MRSEPWTFAQYAEEVAIYRSAIEAAAPGIPLLGPDVSGSAAFESWGPGEAVDEHPAVLETVHASLREILGELETSGRPGTPGLQGELGGGQRK